MTSHHFSDEAQKIHSHLRLRVADAVVGLEQLHRVGIGSPGAEQPPSHGEPGRKCPWQLELPWTFPAGFTVARGLLRPGRAYADAVKLFEPYDRIRDPQPEVRVDLLRLIAEVMRRHMEALILVNNRLEGNAPGTIRALVEMMEQGGNGPG